MSTKNPLMRLRNYVRGSMEESKKITWPTRKETVRYSLLVIVITIAVAAFFAGLDYLFAALLQVII